MSQAKAAFALGILQLITFLGVIDSTTDSIPTPTKVVTQRLGAIQCPPQRKQLVLELKRNPSSRNHNKTLVVILSSTRGHHLTWYNFQRNVLKPLNADLALAVESSTTAAPDSFRSNAKFVWDLPAPPENDYMYYFDEVAMACFNHTFDAHYARIIGRVNFRPSGWLGCVRAANQPACSGQIVFFRWWAMQNIIKSQLFNYTHVVVTRSDFLWVRPHQYIIPRIAFGELHLPEAEDSRGISDRHHVMTMPDAIWSLDVLDAAIERPNPHDQVAWLRKVEFESLSGNLESSLYVWHADIKGQKIMRFEHGALLVRDVDEDQMGTRKVLKSSEPIMNIGPFLVQVRYMEEYEYLRKKGFLH